MGRPKKILCRDKDYLDGKIYICPYCHRYVAIPLGNGLKQCFVCGGFVDTDQEAPVPKYLRVKCDGLPSWR